MNEIIHTGNKTLEERLVFEILVMFFKMLLGRRHHL